MEFTENYKRVLRRSQEEAAKFNEAYVSTEHLFLGLLAVKDSMACRILNRMSINQVQFHAELDTSMTWGTSNVPAKDIQFSTRVRRVFNLAYGEARDLNNNYLGTEHLLLALVLEGQGVVARLFCRYGVDLEKLRAEAAMLQEE